MKLFFFVVFILTIYGCKTSQNNFKDSELVYNSFHSFVFEELEKKTVIKILLYNKSYKFDLFIYPNFFVGITETGDTIGIIDRYFEGEVKLGDSLTFVKDTWTDLDKATWQPLTTVRKEHNLNIIYTSVKTVLSKHNRTSKT